MTGTVRSRRFKVSGVCAEVEPDIERPEDLQVFGTPGDDVTEPFRKVKRYLCPLPQRDA